MGESTSVLDALTADDLHELSDGQVLDRVALPAVAPARGVQRRGARLAVSALVRSVTWR